MRQRVISSFTRWLLTYRRCEIYFCVKEPIVSHLFGIHFGNLFPVFLFRRRCCLAFHGASNRLFHSSAMTLIPHLLLRQMDAKFVCNPGVKKVGQ